MQTHCRIEYEQLHRYLTLLLQNDNSMTNEQLNHIINALKNLNIYLYNMKFDDKIDDRSHLTFNETQQSTTNNEEENIVTTVTRIELPLTIQQEEELLLRPYLQIGSVIQLCITQINEVDDFTAYIANIGIHPLLEEMRTMPLCQFHKAPVVPKYNIGDVVIVFNLQEMKCARAQILKLCDDYQYKVS